MSKIVVPLKNYEGLYEIDADGNIFSVSRLQYNQRGSFISRHIKMKYSFDKRGYLNVILNKDKVRKSYLVHRLVALTFIPNPENKPQVNHKDGNKANPEKSNLEWATQVENMQHAKEMGLRPPEIYGKKKGKAYAIPKNILQQCYKMIEDGISIRQTSIHFGVNRSTLQYQYRYNYIK